MRCFDLTRHRRKPATIYFETMFILRLYDRNGIELKLGDIVRISDGRRFQFYSEIKYLDHGVITPFSTFSYHSIEKVSEVPEGATLSTETRYRIWWINNSDEEDEEYADKFKAYLQSWRECETWIDNKCYRIDPMQNVNNSTQQSLDFG